MPNSLQPHGLQQFSWRDLSSFPFYCFPLFICIVDLRMPSYLSGFPDSSAGKKKICLKCRFDPWFDSWVRKIPCRRERLPTPVFWPGEFHGLYSPWGLKELDRTEWLSLSLSFFSLLAVFWNSAFNWVYLSLSPLLFAYLLSSAPQTTILPSWVSFSWGWFCSLSPVHCYESPSVVLQALCLPDLIPWIYL